MTTTTQIRIEAIRVINKIITLKSNIANGCFSDKKELDIEMPRLAGIKNWAIKNDQLQEIKHYFGSKNFGENSQFAAQEIATYFNN